MGDMILAILLHIPGAFIRWGLMALSEVNSIFILKKIPTKTPLLP